MQTLREAFSEMARYPDRWSYYRDPISSIGGTWEDNHVAYEFIKGYFGLAGKSELFKDSHLEANKRYIKDRVSHIVSTFLIGLRITEILGIDTDTRDDRNMNFKYYWFLSCLYHDIGYAYEEKYCRKWLDMIRQEGLEACQDICDIKYFHNRVFKTVPEEIVNIYFRGRADGKDGKIDHGIIGGLLLYDKLRKQFALAWKRGGKGATDRRSFWIRDENTGRDLHLSNRHFDAYAQAADAIIAHNIWKSTLQGYLENSTDASLRGYDVLPISIDNTLCFVLSLADTIEPLKRDLKYIDLVKIGDCCVAGKTWIALQVDKTTYGSIYSKIEGLYPWLDVIVEIDDMGTDYCIRIAPNK